MKTINRCPSSGAGFTLVELMVTISVIALLAALLLGAVSQGKQRAVALTCVNNLSQWGLAVNLYTADQNDHLPFAIYKNRDANVNNFHGLLYPYLAKLPFSYKRDFI